MRPDPFQLVTELQAIANLPADGTPAASVDERVQLVAGQAYPVVVPGQRWRMSNNALYEAVAGLSSQLQVLTDLVAATRADVLPRLLLAQAATDAVLAKEQADKTQLDALASQQQATTLAMNALQAYQASSAATLVTVQARLGTDQAAIATAQAAADAAKASATTAINNAATAQSRADAAQATASQALALAQAATASQAQLSARFRVARLASPVLALGATATLLVTWQPAFADANYSVVAECEGTALLGLTATVTARTATGCTVQIKNSLGLAIALGAGTISLLATHD